jgi:hypothetical protein
MKRVLALLLLSVAVSLVVTAIAFRLSSQRVPGEASPDAEPQRQDVEVDA